MSEFPIGRLVADRWTFRDELCGGPDRGMYRATGPTTVLVTMGAPQQQADELARFAYSGEGIARFPGIASPARAVRAGENMAMQMDAEGFGTCTNLSQCEAVCPKEIPTRVIAEFNRDLIKANLKGS